MNGYVATTGLMDLQTVAANSGLASLSVPAASAFKVYIKRLSFRGGFSAAALAASWMAFGVSRATGTAAAGTGSKATTSIAKRGPGMANSIATFRYGPTPITGLTDDTPGDFLTTFLTHQLGTPFSDVLLDDIRNMEQSEPIVINPGTSLVIRNRTIGVAGSLAAFVIEWAEVPL